VMQQSTASQLNIVGMRAKEKDFFAEEVHEYLTMDDGR
jgi:hypothetical protein